jgi:chromate reductase
MTDTLKIAAVVGSLRRESFTRRLVLAMKDLAPATVSVTLVEIGRLPLFNQDDEEDPTAEVLAFREAILGADAVLFATPEYNRSMPGVLKNAVDVGSRPYGKSVWSGKPAAIISVTPGGLGGFGANHALRQALVFLNMPTMLQPEAYIGNVAKVLDADGKIAIDATRQFCTSFMIEFEKWSRKQRV